MDRVRRRVFLGLVLVAVATVGIYWFALRGSSTPTAEAKRIVPVAQIGEGKTVLIVGSDGKLLGSMDG
jgi:hypothetical protein